MTDEHLNKLIERFKNLLAIQIDMQYETIDGRFTEYDLKQIIYFLGELKALRESGAADKWVRDGEHGWKKA